MDYTKLKQTDMTISRVGIGTNKVGGHNYWKNLSETDGKNFVKESIRLGVNFIDTADIYGHGRSEELVGEVLKEIDTPREKLVIATKGGNQLHEDGTVTKNNRPEYLRSALEASLKRLQLDYVDLYYLHFPDKETPISESIGELKRLQEEGKIKAIGVSNLNLAQLKEAVATADIAALQSGYNMFDRAVEQDVLPFCAEKGISFIPYFPLASGLLSGKYTPENPGREKFKEEGYREKLEKVAKLKEVAEAKETTMPKLALAWLLAQAGVDAVIPGGRDPEQARGVVGAADVKLTRDELAKIEAILA
ncbi:MAG TPA: aldo/keto reductase [Bacillales bacterium]|nr:aldo/keto reductase [Bacillales bacterium]